MRPPSVVRATTKLSASYVAGDPQYVNEAGSDGPFYGFEIGPGSEWDSVLIETPSGNYVCSVGAPVVSACPIEGPINIRPWGWAIPYVSGAPQWFGKEMYQSIPEFEVICHYAPTSLCATKRAPSRRLTWTTADGTLWADDDYVPCLEMPFRSRRLASFTADAIGIGETPLSNLRLAIFGVRYIADSKAYASQYRQLGPREQDRGTTPQSVYNPVIQRLVLDTSSGTPAYDLAWNTVTADDLKYTGTFPARNDGQNLSVRIVDEGWDTLVVAVRTIVPIDSGDMIVRVIADAYD